MSEHRAKLAWVLLSEKEKETAGLTDGRQAGVVAEIRVTIPTGRVWRFRKNGACGFRQE
ncbi:MAG: hypothetical protein MJZ46_06150 [Bacteroidales bacterium]|nr:hypothetical protein [Bacteroidales bacterium]